MPRKKSPQFREQEDTEESLSEGSDIVQSDDEECMEENDDVPMESEEKLEDSDENIQDSIDEIQDSVSSDVKEKQSLINVDDKDAEETKDDLAVDEELLGGSSEGSVESDQDEDLIKREEELLKDDESLDRNGDLVLGENDEYEDLVTREEELLRDDGCLDRNGDLIRRENDQPEKLELVGGHVDTLEKTTE